MFAPAALSIVETDHRYRADWQDIAPRLVITLDGKPQDSVVTYDTSEGLIVRHVQRDGQYVVEGDEIATETLTGHVAVALSD